MKNQNNTKNNCELLKLLQCLREFNIENLNSKENLADNEKQKYAEILIKINTVKTELENIESSIRESLIINMKSDECLYFPNFNKKILVGSRTNYEINVENVITKCKTLNLYFKLLPALKIVKNKISDTKIKKIIDENESVKNQNIFIKIAKI